MKKTAFIAIGFIMEVSKHWINELITSYLPMKIGKEIKEWGKIKEMDQIKESEQSKEGEWIKESEQISEKIKESEQIGESEQTKEIEQMKKSEQIKESEQIEESEQMKKSEHIKKNEQIKESALTATEEKPEKSAYPAMFIPPHPIVHPNRPSRGRTPQRRWLVYIRVN